MKTKLALIALFLMPSFAFATLPVGKLAPLLTLSGKAGGRLDGSAWSSKELVGKVHLLVYSAPGQKDLNNKATEAVKARNFARDKFASVAVVNLAASWLPDSLITSAIEEKQKMYPLTTYVTDADKAVVKTWGLADKNNDLVVFDKEGKVVFSHDGQLNASQIEDLLNCIAKSL